MTIPPERPTLANECSTKASSSYALRPATSADADAVSTLIRRVWSTHFAYSVSPADLAHFIETALSPQQIKADIESDAMRFLLAVSPSPCSEPADDANASTQASADQADAVVGVAQLVLGTTEPCLTLPRPVELRRLYVDDVYHGTGLARALVDGAGIAARGEGFESMWLGVWENNTRGIRFYEKMGFERKGEHTFLVGDSVRRDWVMEKGLI